MTAGIVERARPLSAPRDRGPLSAWVLAGAGRRGAAPVLEGIDAFSDDLQLALYLCYEGHYSDIPGVVLDEWDPGLIAFRRRLEDRFVTALETVVAPIPTDPDVPARIREIVDDDSGPSLSRYMETTGTLEQMRTFVAHRSPYQLKEADPHTHAIARVAGRAKQVLAEIQAGEYGADEPDRAMHSELFAQTMRGLGLDDRPHAYLDQLPASSLMISNLISLFGLNRRWRGALIGHLAVFEMTSVEPMGRYSRALQRLGLDRQVRRFYDVHILADAEHEVMAMEMATALAEDEPQLRRDIVFGARCASAVEAVFANHLLDSFTKGTRTAA